MKNPITENKSNLAIREGWVSIIVNTLLFIIKYWAGIVTGSIAIIADAWHTMSDSISSVVLLIGIKIANKPADKEHPFGHGRAEAITTIAIGLILVFIAFAFFIESVRKLSEHEATNYGTLAIVVTVISIVVKELLAQYAYYIARKTKSDAVRADGWHHRSDAISSVIILIGIFAGSHFWWIDGVLGILVAIMIFYAAWEVQKDTLFSLLGEIPDEKTISEVNDICRLVAPGNFDAHHFHMHRYGKHIEMTFHIRLPKDMLLFDAHEIADTIETRIRSRMDIHATIHLDVVKTKGL